MWWSSSSHLWLRSSELVYLQLTSSLVWIKPLHVQRSETSEWFGTWAGRRRNPSSARDTIKAGIAGKPHKPREKTQVKHFRDCQRFFLLACVFKVDVKKFSYCGSKLARYWIPLWLFFLSTVFLAALFCVIWNNSVGFCGSSIMIMIILYWLTNRQPRDKLLLSPSCENEMM